MEAVIFIYVIYFAVMIGVCIAWGVATNKVIENKGYNENWFWWGFFFGLIALVVALTKPDNNYMRYDQRSGGSALSAMSEQKRREEQIRKGYWQCSCGTLNPPHTTTCACGKTPKDVKAEQAKAAADAAEEEKLNNLKKLKEYKELFEAGVISQEEFEQQKAKILNN